METDIFRRRRLPHWDMPNAAYFVTTCLAGSIPAKGLLDLESYRCSLAKRPRRPGTTKSEWQREHWKLQFARVDHWLDHEPAARCLADARLAATVVQAMYHFAGSRYDLLAFVIMPSHIHWVFQPLPKWVQGFKPDAIIPSPR